MLVTVTVTRLRISRGLIAAARERPYAHESGRYGGYLWTKSKHKGFFSGPKVKTTLFLDNLPPSALTLRHWSLSGIGLGLCRRRCGAELSPQRPRRCVGACLRCAPQLKVCTHTEQITPKISSPPYPPGGTSKHPCVHQKLLHAAARSHTQPHAATTTAQQP